MITVEMKDGKTHEFGKHGNASVDYQGVMIVITEFNKRTAIPSFDVEKVTEDLNSRARF